MIRIITIALLLLALQAMAYSQGAHYTYPFKVECTAGLVRAGSVAMFSAEFEGGHTGDNYSPTYSWAITHGTIVEGHGTPAITVELSKEDRGSITVTLERTFTEAHYPGVQRTANCTAEIEAGPKAQLVDEFRTGGMNCEEGFARLDSYFNELNNNPSAEGVIVVYGDAADRRAAARREKQLRNHIQLRRFDRTRITFIRGAAKSEGATQFWLVHPGADRPEVSGGVVTTGAASAPTTVSYLYATEYSDGIPGCFGNLYDLEEFAGVLNSDPKSTARIVVSQHSQASYRRKVREIVTELAAHGIKQTRIVTVYKYVRPNRLLEVTELWVVPPKRQAALMTDEIEATGVSHRCPQGGLASIFRC